MTRAIFFNSPYLGGAERSIIHQAKISQKDFDFYIPLLKEDDDYSQIKNLLEDEFNNPKIITFQYPKGLFQVSRFGKIGGLIYMPLYFIQIFMTFRKLSLSKYDLLWGNGNKISFVLFLFCCLSFFKGHFIWHFRDYPIITGKWSYFWKVFSIPHLFKMTLLANSKDVENSLKKIATKNQHVTFVYNPSGVKQEKLKTTRDNRVIGLASMLAPWKGQHDIIFFVSLFADEFRKEKIVFHIYGKELYQTSGEHQNYTTQLKKLIDRYSINDLVFLKGNESPLNIFSNIDLMIHSSMKPEPFGRVITESFKYGVPVLSTGLGGSGELFEFIPESVYELYDYQGQYQKIIQILNDHHYHQELLMRQSQMLDKIESEISSYLISNI